MIEQAQTCASKIAEYSGDAGGTRVEIAELRNHYQIVLNGANGRIIKDFILTGDSLSWICFYIFGI